MTGSSSQVGHFVCAICTSALQIPEEGVTTIANHHACSQCVQDLFDHSIASESNFPPRWGRQVLDPWNFRHILSEDFLRRFKEIAAEYGCPTNERVYCQNRISSAASPSSSSNVEECSKFMGRQRPETATGRSRCELCDKCNAATCLRCLQTFPPLRSEDAQHAACSSSSQLLIQHRCDLSTARRLRERAFEGLQRGRHYQDCPNCRRRIELMDGCNHITCPCGESYCYICGRAVTEHSQHWDRGRGRCPRYGRPGSRTALFTDDLDGYGTDDDGQDTGSGSSDDSSDSDYVPSEHGDMVLEEHRARWQMQYILESQARREQRRDDRTMRRAAHGRAHVQELARQRDMAVQTTTGELNDPDEEHARYRMQVVLDHVRRDQERDPENLRDIQQIRSNLAQPWVQRDTFVDADAQAAPGAENREMEDPRLHSPTMTRFEGNQTALRPYHDEDRNQWLMVDELDNHRGRSRILHARPELDRRYRPDSPPQPLPRGTRFLEHNRQMRESIAIERALAEGPAGSPDRPLEHVISSRSRLHRTDPGSSVDSNGGGRRRQSSQSPNQDIGGREPRLASPYRAFSETHATQGRNDTQINRDWEYYVGRSHQFEQQRPSRRHASTENLRGVAVAIDEGYRSRRHSARSAQRSYTSFESDAWSAQSGRYRHADLRRGRAQRWSLDSRHTRYRHAHQAPGRGWRSIPGRLWRYLQRQ